MPRPIVLIDASSYFFRAFHALPPLTNSKGQPTGAIYGVVNMIKRLIKDYEPTQLAVIFDAPGKTFRDEWYPAYKANRPPTPTDLSSQFKPLIALLTAMGLPLIIMDGVEADDVIGSFSTEATRQSRNVLISTGDKDMAQLVNPHVSLINTMTNQHLDEMGVQEKFGIKPDQMIDYLTLVGDTSDNVPGVSGCGPKTAVKWLTLYQTLDNLIAHAHEINGKIGESLRAALPQLALSRKLVTIKTDLTLPLTLAELTPRTPDKEALVSLARELEFKRWISEWSDEQTITPPITQSRTTHIHEPSALDTVTTLINTSPKLSLYLDTHQNTLQGIMLAIDHLDAFHIPFKTDNTPGLPLFSVLMALKPALENPSIQKVGHDLKHTYTLLKQHDIRLAGLTYDTMLESYLLNSTTKHDLTTLINHHLEQPIHPGEEAVAIHSLHEKLYQQLSEPLKSLLQNIEMPLISILANMEIHGVLIDATQLATQGARLHTQIDTLEKEAYHLAEHPFNLNSPKQLLDILYNEQKLPILAKTPKGQPSTAEPVLQELSLSYRLPAIILEYRSLSKLVSTYIEALPKRMDKNNKRVHTSYNQAVTTTGRLSSSDPNLQNIPIRQHEGRLIRKAFIAPSNALLLTADYSQIELRIMAHLSADPQLISAFSKGLDIHSATASEIFSVPLELVTSDQRRRAKAVNFGLIYGMSSFGLAKQLTISRNDAEHYINRYFERYPGVLTFMEQTQEKARQVGYVETLFGRRLYVPEINASNKIRQKAAERMAINAPLQGTAADIIKKAMIDIISWQKNTADHSTTMIMQVHDELVFEVQKNNIEFIKAHIQTLMENTVALNVPLLVSIGTGQDWDTAH